MSVFEYFTPDEQDVIMGELSVRDTELLEHLQTRARPSAADDDAWHQAIGDAIQGEFWPPDYEPTEYALRLEKLMDKYVDRWSDDVADEE